MVGGGYPWRFSLIVRVCFLCVLSMGDGWSLSAFASWLRDTVVRFSWILFFPALALECLLVGCLLLGKHGFLCRQQQTAVQWSAPEVVGGVDCWRFQMPPDGNILNMRAHISGKFILFLYSEFYMHKEKVDTLKWQCYKKQK